MPDEIFENIDKTVNLNRTASLSKFSFFKPLHFVSRSYQVPVLLICPLRWSFLEFKVFIFLAPGTLSAKDVQQIFHIRQLISLRSQFQVTASTSPFLKAF